MLLAVAFRALMRGLTYVGLTLVFLFLAYAALQLRNATADDDTRAARADQTSMLPGRVVGTVNAPPGAASMMLASPTRQGGTARVRPTASAPDRE